MAGIEELAQRFYVTYGSVVSGATREYAVISTEKGLVFEGDSKVEAIAYAQRRSGFSPVDGEEATYARQIREETAE